jgi:hypothetical protein
MTEKEKQLHDRKLIEKETKRFMKRLKDLNPLLKSVMVTDINLKIEEKKKVFNAEDFMEKPLAEKPELIVDKRSFKDKIMGL